MPQPDNSLKEDQPIDDNLDLAEKAEADHECGDPHCGDHHEMMMPFRRESPKVGRNDPCPCGSGKKHKKCCLSAGA